VREYLESVLPGLNRKLAREVGSLPPTRGRNSAGSPNNPAYCRRVMGTGLVALT
jgi:hypothetical protein